ncbi:MAG: hypothetical protein Q7T23_14335 [Phenylobacterium sp.]|nr:hypothetical protein [Phenylobacterium sp.]
MPDKNKPCTNSVVSDAAIPNAASDPSFFEGRLMIDILAWDWNLRVAICDHAVTRPKARSLGLDYGRDFTIHGRVRAPREHRGKSIKVTLSPFGPKVRFGRGALQNVGKLTILPEGSVFEFEAVLMLPEAAIASTASSLASTWKHLQIKIHDVGPGGAEASAYFFQSSIHPNLEAWANAD